MIIVRLPETPVCLEISYHVQYNPTSRRFEVDETEIRGIGMCAAEL